MGSEGQTFNDSPSLPRLVRRVAGTGGRFPLTVAGPRRFFTGLPCYALAGIRKVIQLSTVIPTAGYLALSTANIDGRI